MKSQKYKNYIGIDEVGRGPLAGPVSVCAFMVSEENISTVHKQLSGITDSKKLSVKKREHYLKEIQEMKKEGRVDYAVSHVSAATIDEKGIVYAISLAIKKSLQKLELNPNESFVALDGGLYAPHEYQQETIIKGDQKNWLIGAASVIAKVVRDNKMAQLGLKYPKYDLGQNKGYGTVAHRKALQKYGTTKIHRTSWINTP